MSDDAAETCWECDNIAKWTWWNGKGGTGLYCDEHAREQLPNVAKIASYKSPITTAEMQKRRSGPVTIPGGGVCPLNGQYPVIRAKEPFDRWVAYHD